MYVSVMHILKIFHRAFITKSALRLLHVYVLMYSQKPIFRHFILHDKFSMHFGLAY